MLSAVVFERKNEDIAAGIAKSLAHLRWRCGDGLIIASRLGKNHTPSLVVVSPRSARESALPQRAVCGTLLIPGGSDSAIRAGNICTYGSSSGYVISVQRELSTLTGETVDAQDIPVKRKPPMSADGTLALSAALLLLGVPPQMLQ